MDVYSATEEAYKNGYEKGYSKGLEDAKNTEYGEWIDVPSMLGTKGWKVKCSLCNAFEYHPRSFCPNCGKRMRISNIVKSR